MKYLLVIFCLMTFKANAGCMLPFSILSIANSEPEALEKIKLKAYEECGNDDFAWASLVRILGSEEVEVDGEILIKAQAQYRCCFAW